MSLEELEVSTKKLNFWFKEVAGIRNCTLSDPSFSANLGGDDAELRLSAQSRLLVRVKQGQYEQLMFLQTIPRLPDSATLYGVIKVLRLWVTAGELVNRTVTISPEVMDLIERQTRPMGGKVLRDTKWSPTGKPEDPL